MTLKSCNHRTTIEESQKDKPKSPILKNIMLWNSDIKFSKQSNILWNMRINTEKQKYNTFKGVKKCV